MIPTTTNNDTANEVSRLPSPESSEEHRELEFDEPLRPLHLTLSPPVEFDGKHYGELLFDFGKLIGKDFLRAEREFTHRYKPEKNEVVIPETKQLYRVIVAAHTADVPVGVIEKLPGRYYTSVINDVLKLYGSSADEAKA